MDCRASDLAHREMVMPSAWQGPLQGLRSCLPSGPGLGLRRPEGPCVLSERARYLVQVGACRGLWQGKRNGALLSLARGLALVTSGSRFDAMKIKSESGRQPTLALICSPQLLQSGGMAAGAAGDCSAGAFLAEGTPARSLEGDRQC